MAPISGPDATAGREDGGLELRHDAALERAVAQHPVGLVDGDVLDHNASHQHARDVTDEHDPFGTEADCERRRSLVGVDVERPPADEPGRQRRDDRNPSGSERLLDCGRRRGSGVTDEPEILDLRGEQPDLVTEERNRRGADRGADLPVDLGERGANDLQHLGRGHAPPPDERRSDPPSLHLRRDLRPGTVDDDDLVARAMQRERLGCCPCRYPASKLEDDPAHVVYSALMRT